MDFNTLVEIAMANQLANVSSTSTNDTDIIEVDVTKDSLETTVELCDDSTDDENDYHQDEVIVIGSRDRENETMGQDEVGQEKDTGSDVSPKEEEPERFFRMLRRNHPKRTYMPFQATPILDSIPSIPRPPPKVISEDLLCLNIVMGNGLRLVSVNFC